MVVMVVVVAVTVMAAVVVVVVGVGGKMGACRKGSCTHHPPTHGIQACCK